MTVKELIEKLQHLPPDTEVFFHNDMGEHPLETNTVFPHQFSDVFVEMIDRDGTLRLIFSDVSGTLPLDLWLRTKE